MVTVAKRAALVRRIHECASDLDHWSMNYRELATRLIELGGDVLELELDEKLEDERMELI
jgi:hypothetical protein